MFHGNVSLEIAQGLKELQKRIDAAKIPSSKLDETLNLATWNIREFGRKPRKQAAIHYIAEIIGQFDIVSIVELRENLRDLSKVLQILGPYWHVVYSDMIPDAGGNSERLAFVYDKRAADSGIRGFLRLVVLMEALDWNRDGEVIEQLSRVPRIFTEETRAASDGLDSAGSHVPEIPDRRSNQNEFAHRRSY